MQYPMDQLTFSPLRLQLRFQTGTGHCLLRKALDECSSSLTAPPECTTLWVLPLGG